MKRNMSNVDRIVRVVIAALFAYLYFGGIVTGRDTPSMQITERGDLFVNLGWYFQYPLFDYLYTGLDRIALAKGLGAITGNPDLEPERTRQWEMLRLASDLLSQRFTNQNGHGKLLGFQSWWETISLSPSATPASAGTSVCG
jgi:hypothetical protein